MEGLITSCYSSLLARLILFMESQWRGTVRSVEFDYWGLACMIA